MIKSREIFFKEIALLPEMKDNIISLVFALHPEIDISNKTKVYETILPFFRRYTNGKERDAIKIEDNENEKGIRDITEWEGSDLRIKNIRIKSVRGYPNSDKPFGFSLVNDEDVPKSMIILGANGVGKSSLYSAIEYTYCRAIGEARLRTKKELTERDYQIYLQHNNEGYINSFCTIETMKNPFRLQDENIPKSVRNKINPDTHFISDYDIYSNGQLNYDEGGDNSFQIEIAKSLGLDELLLFETNIKSFASYRRLKETKDISAHQKSNESHENTVKTGVQDIEGKKTQLAQIRKTQTALPLDNSIQEGLGILNNVRTYNFSFSFVHADLLKEIAEYNDRYNDFLAKSIKSGGAKELQFLDLGLELLNESDSCPFCNSSRKTTVEIKTDVSARIETIKSSNVALQSLSKSSNIVLDRLSSLLNELVLLRGKVVKEQNILLGQTDFSSLYTTEIEFVEYLTKNLSEELFTSLQGMQENPTYTKDKNKFLFDLLSTHKDYVETRLKDSLAVLLRFQTRREELLMTINNALTAKAGSQTLIQQIALLEAEIKTSENSIAFARTQIKNNEAEILRIREAQKLFEEIQRQTKMYATTIHTKLNGEIDQAFRPIQSIVEGILNDYLTKDNKDVKIEVSREPDVVDEETGEVLSEIITAKIKLLNGNEKPIPVNRYLNTFYYRLFSTMVGLSVAIASRINTKINMPLVLDDIFYASDFENRAKIETFLKNVFDLFKSYTDKLDLQLIMFTHDQLIFESAIKASFEHRLVNTVFAKLFTPAMANDTGDYKTLIYELPTYLPQHIYENTMVTV